MGKSLKTDLVLDWYDGIVLALVQPSWRNGTFLASLLSWSQSTRKRVLALLPVDATEAARIASCQAEGGWAELIEQLHGVAHHTNGPISVVVVDELIDEVCREETVDVESVRGRLIVDIEQAMQVDIGPWLP